MISRVESFYVDVEAENEEKAIELYCEGETSDEYGHKIIDEDILEVD